MTSSISVFFKRINLGIFSFLFLVSCYKNHLYVQQEVISKNFLASSYALTPDPRQEIPFKEQRLLIGWDFPKSLFEKKLIIRTTVRFWDQSQKEFLHSMDRQRDALALSFLHEENGEKILTYRVEVWTERGDLLETWYHPLWTECIDVDRSAVQRRSEAVSSHPKQASVMETP